jgi:hypothetical protein
MTKNSLSRLDKSIDKIGSYKNSTLYLQARKSSCRVVFIIITDRDVKGALLV